MKTRLFLLPMITLLLALGNISFAQNSGITMSLSKTNGKIFSINETGKHLLSFDISGIENAKHAENIMKFVRGYRGVESFELTPIAGTNNWKGEGVFYEYSDNAYFKNLFKLMKVSEIIQDNVKSNIDNL